MQNACSWHSAGGQPDCARLLDWLPWHGILNVTVHVKQDEAAALPRPSAASKAARKRAARAARKAAASTEQGNGQHAARPTHDAAERTHPTAAEAEPDASPAQCTATECDMTSSAAAAAAGECQEAVVCTVPPTTPQVPAAAERTGNAAALDALGMRLTEAEWSMCPLSKALSPRPDFYRSLILPACQNFHSRMMNTDPCLQDVPWMP